jgi:hypothetical protein
MACGDELRLEYLRDRRSGDRRPIGSGTGSYCLALMVFAAAGAGLFLGSVAWATVGR